jgi:hypothetical protein
MQSVLVFLSHLALDLKLKLKQKNSNICLLLIKKLMNVVKLIPLPVSRPPVYDCGGGDVSGCMFFIDPPYPDCFSSSALLIPKQSYDFFQ